MRLAACLVACLMALPVFAQDVRPVARPSADPTPTYAIRPEARPIERPELGIAAVMDPQLRAEQNLFAFSPTATTTSMRPLLRPAAIEAEGEARRLARIRGQVCGVPSTQGQVLGYVNGAGACGVQDAVKVRAVAGVTLSPRATIDCPTAQALLTWVFAWPSRYCRSRPGHRANAVKGRCTWGSASALLPSS